MNRIPVMTKNHNTRFYEDLPILFVDRWEEISEPFLQDHLKRFVDQSFNFDKLKMSYWQRRILGAK
jgi:hypothetical protein